MSSLKTKSWTNPFFRWLPLLWKVKFFQFCIHNLPYQPNKNARSGCTPVEICYTTIHLFLFFCGTVCILNIVKIFVCKRRIYFIIIVSTTPNSRLKKCMYCSIVWFLCTSWLYNVHVMFVHLRPTRVIYCKDTNENILKHRKSNS